MNKVTAHDVAKYIIAEFHEAEDFITNMKVQKLLYYVQRVAFRFIWSASIR